MNLRFSSVFLAAVLLSAASISAHASSAGAVPVAATEKPSLAKGMTADAIVAAIGKPTEIKRMASDKGKAEAWIYRRHVGSRIQQNAATVRMIPVFQGVMADGHGTMGEAAIPEMHLEHIDIYQVTSLLVFDGKLTLAKQWTERKSSIDQ